MRRKLPKTWPLKTSSVLQYPSTMGDTPEKPVVNYHRMGTIDIYPVTEDELQALESGGPAASCLAFGLMLISVAGTAGVTVATVPNLPETPKLFLVVVFVACLVASLICFILWWKLPSNTKEMTRRIRSRKSAVLGTSGAEQPSGEQR